MRSLDTVDWQAAPAVQLAQPRPSDLILEVATGTGLAARACVPATGAPERVIGIDVSIGMPKIAARTPEGRWFKPTRPPRSWKRLTRDDWRLLANDPRSLCREEPELLYVCWALLG